MRCLLPDEFSTTVFDLDVLSKTTKEADGGGTAGSGRMKSLRGFSRGLNIQWSAVASCIGVRPKREVSTSETFISSSPEEGDTDFPRGFIRGEIPPREVSQGERGVKVRTGNETCDV